MMRNLAILIAVIGVSACLPPKKNKLPTIVDPRTGPNTSQDATDNPLPNALPDAPTQETQTTTNPDDGSSGVSLPPMDDELKTAAQTANIGDEIPSSSRSCSDPNFGKAGLEVCIKMDAGTRMSRFSSFTLQFSLLRTAGKAPEELLKDSIEKNFEFVDDAGKAVEGLLLWKDSRTLVFDPKGELLSNVIYHLRVRSTAGDSKRPRSSQGRILTPFVYDISTQAAFAANFAVNGQALPSDRGLMMLSQEVPSLKLRVDIDQYQQAKTVTLRRLGKKASLTLCAGSCGKGSFEVNLIGSEIAPEPGLNSYEMHASGQNGEEIYKHMSFGWGDVNTEPDAPIAGGVFAAVDREDGLKALSSLVGNFAAGRFTMDYRDESSQVVPKQTFNDIIRFKRSTYRQSIPADCDKRADTNFEYLQNLGPFCNMPVSGSTPLLGGFAGKVVYKANTDIYVTDMQVIQEDGNVEAQMIPNKDNLELHLGAKKFKGKLKIILRVDEARWAGALPVPGASGYFIFETDFVLDGPMRETIAKTNMSIANGRLKISLNGSSSFDMKKTIQGSPQSSVYFDTKAWTDAVQVSDVNQIDESTGLWAKLINLVINQAVNEQVDSFKPQIVNGIARDILQVVAPNALNTLIEQMKVGLQIFLPAHLPSPLDKTKLQLTGQLGSSLSYAVTSNNSYLLAPIQMGLKTLLNNPNGKPKEMQGPNGYFRTKNSQAAPSPLTAAEIPSSGSLLSVSMDTANQALYDTWKQGLLNLAIDSAFIDKIETFAVLDPTNENNGREILLAEFLPKLMGSDITRMRGIGDDGKPITMDKTDKITILIEPRLPPFLRMKTVPRDDGNLDTRFVLDLSDLQMRIQGVHEGRRYSIVTMRMSMTGDSTIRFVPYKNPMRHAEFSGLGALSLFIDKNPASLDFMVDVREEDGANSFSLDTARLRSTVSDMVDQLFIPLLNDGLREVPLTGLRMCGIELDASNMDMLPLPASVKSPFMVLRAPLKTYSFSGHCDLLPDLTSPLPPLPPEPETPEPENPPTTPTDPGSGSNGPAQHGELDMNFSKIPWTLNSQGTVPEVAEECKSQIFFDVSCPIASVEYEKENGAIKKDQFGRPIYAYTHIILSTLVPKDSYKLRGPAPSIEAQFFDFAKWADYVQGAEDSIVFKDSIAMSDLETQYGTFKRHYVDFETNSPKASGFIPIRDVTYHRVLEQAYQGAEVTTEFFIDTSTRVEVPAGKKALNGAEGLEFHVGNTHILDCGKVSWCQDSGQWLVIYDSKLRPQDTSIPEDVLPYLKAGLNAIIAGMFPVE